MNIVLLYLYMYERERFNNLFGLDFSSGNNNNEIELADTVNEVMYFPDDEGNVYSVNSVDDVIIDNPIQVDYDENNIITPDDRMNILAMSHLTRKSMIRKEEDKAEELSPELNEIKTISERALRARNAKKRVKLDKTRPKYYGRSNATFTVSEEYKKMKEMIKNKSAIQNNIIQEGVKIDRIGLRLNRKFLNIKKKPFYRKSPVVFSGRGEYYHIFFDSEILPNDDILYKRLFLLLKFCDDLGFWSKEISIIIQDIKLSELEKIDILLANYFTLIRLEVAFDFYDNIMSKLTKKYFKNVKGTLYSPEAIRTKRNGRKKKVHSFICAYDKGLKECFNDKLYRLEFRFFKNYIKQSRLNPVDFHKCLTEPIVYLAFINAKRIATNIRHSMKKKNVFHKLQEYISDKPQYLLLDWILKTAYPESIDLKSIPNL